MEFICGFITGIIFLIIVEFIWVSSVLNDRTDEELEDKVLKGSDTK